MHGLGDTGSGWGFLAQYLQQRDPAAFQHTNFVFPNAPELHVTANGGALMPAWFDILEWDPSFSKVDSDGFMNSLNSIEKTVKQEIDKGIKPEQIIIGGFSQGAALARNISYFTMENRWYSSSVGILFHPRNSETT